MNRTVALLPLLAALSLTQPAAASGQDAVRSAPLAAALPAAIPPARDEAFPGTIGLAIDATDVTRGVFKVEETIPVPPGTRELVLLSPEWLNGKHAPRPWIRLLADFHFAADGKPVTWTRDAINVNALHVSIPEGAKQLTARFVFTSPLKSTEGRIVMTQEMLNLQWDAMSLYPAGYYARRIAVRPAVTFPEDWTAFTALDGQSAPSGTVRWDATDYETLVDSPVFAGKHARRWDLGHDVSLDVVADKPSQLELAPEHLATYRKLVDEALELFGAKHFDHYDFLLSQTDRMGDIGLEHQRSSENSQNPDTLVKWDAGAWDRNVIPHEFVHSWNGKYRRPAGLYSPDYRHPMQDQLLWAYEGQTQFWGYVLAARSGVQPKDVVLGMFASAAGYYSNLAGRKWRSVEDTTFDPIVDARKPQPYASLSLNEEYYSEGALVWLEADQVIREGTGGRKGLDDFARAFFGVNDGDWGTLTYTFDDVVAALDAVYSYDWAGFLDTRLRQPNQPAPLGGIEKAGYKLEWKEEMNPYHKQRYDSDGTTSLQYSLGMNLDKEGKVGSTQWDSPAFNAGLVTGTQVIAVNGTAFSKDVMVDAVKAAKGGKEPIELLVRRGDRYLTVPIDYHGGLRYPWLVPASDGEQPLDRLLAPRTGG
ncbi:M61 family metallopeptidase [Croceibacterium salegens]|nr:peptidase M61 [Croceibacterium salegens]